MASSMPLAATSRTTPPPCVSSGTVGRRANGAPTRARTPPATERQAQAVLSSRHALLRISGHGLPKPVRGARPLELDGRGLPRVHVDRPAEAALHLPAHARRW